MLARKELIETKEDNSEIQSFIWSCLIQQNMGLVVTKPVFRTSDKARLKPACSATETSYQIEIWLVASLDIILSNKRITKALIRLCGWAGWSAPLLFANHRRHVCFLASRSISRYVYLTT